MLFGIKLAAKEILVATVLNEVERGGADTVAVVADGANGGKVDEDETE